MSGQNVKVKYTYHKKSCPFEHEKNTIYLGNTLNVGLQNCVKSTLRQHSTKLCCYNGKHCWWYTPHLNHTHLHGGNKRLGSVDHCPQTVLYIILLRLQARISSIYLTTTDNPNLFAEFLTAPPDGWTITFQLLREHFVFVSFSVECLTTILLTL